MNFIRTFALIFAWGYIASANANLVSNPDFESGNVDGWSIVGVNDGCNSLQASLYSGIFGGPIPSIGGDYGAHMRVGGALDTGMMQTVNGVPAVELTYSVDFYVREVQNPGGDWDQTIVLYLNGNPVDQLFVDNPTADPGTVGNFSGTFDNLSENVEISIVSERVGCGSSHGQLIVDNVFLDCTDGECEAPPPPPVVSESVPIPALSTYGIALMVISLFCAALIGIKRLTTIR